MRIFERKASRIPVLIRLGTDYFAKGTVINISGGGLAIATKIQTKIGDKLEVKFSGGATFDAVVSRLFHSAIGVELTEPRCIQQRINDTVKDLPEGAHNVTRLSIADRVSERVSCDGAPVTVKFNGEERTAALLNISETGAAIVSTVTPPVGSKILVDGIRGEVVRSNYLLLGVKFDTPINEDNKETRTGT